MVNGRVSSQQEEERGLVLGVCIHLTDQEHRWDNNPLSAVKRVTERKRADEEIQKLNADLTQRAKELDTINKELESFSYSVSHDLRAPLRGIDGFSQALLDEYGDRLDDKGQHYLKRVRAATQRMACLIDDMLTLSRVTRHELMRKEVDLSALAADAAADLMKAEPERCVEFVIEPNVIAFGDPRLLTAVLENLIGNAWKFTSKHPRARIQFGTIAQDGSTVYCVRDDGAGFDMAYSGFFGTFSSFILNPSFRVLGLTWRGTAPHHRHGGRVWAECAEQSNLLLCPRTAQQLVGPGTHQKVTNERQDTVS